MKRSLRIGVDCRELQYGMGGISRFLSNMLKALSETCHEIIVFTHDGSGLKNLNVRIVTVPCCPIPFIEDQIFLRKAARKAKIDIFVSPYYKIPLFLGSKGIITIHDLTVLMNPVLPFWFRLYFRGMTKIFASKADRVFTPSECSKEDVLNYFRIDHRKVKVVYNMVPEQFKPTVHFDPLKYNIAGLYILYVGNLCPHKNLKALLQAYAILEDGVKHKHQLVIVGKTGGIIGRIDQNTQYLELIERSRRLGIKDDIRFIECVDEKDLPGLYSHAGVLVLPSYYEGFGLPVIEAMACGCPVIISDRSSLPEIAGDAALVMEPDNWERLAGKINLILKDQDLRKDLIIKGLNRAGNFGYEKMRALVVEAIESVVFEIKERQANWLGRPRS